MRGAGRVVVQGECRMMWEDTEDGLGHQGKPARGNGLYAVVYRASRRHQVEKQGDREVCILERALSSVWKMGLRNVRENNTEVVRSSFKETTVALATVGMVGRGEISRFER